MSSPSTAEPDASPGGGAPSTGEASETKETAGENGTPRPDDLHDPAEAGSADPARAGGRAALPARGGSARSRWARVGMAVAGGLLLYLAFPAASLWFLAPPGVGLLALSVRGSRVRTAAFLGYLGGAAFLLPTLAWERVVGVDAWLGVVALISLFHAALGAGTALVARLPGWPVWTACLWVAMEAARSVFPFGGFPWARLAFSQSESVFTPYAALGGAPLVTFAVALCGTLLAAAALRVSGRPRGRSETPARPGGIARLGDGPRAVVTAVCALAVAVLGYAVPRPGAEEGGTVRVGIVQGNVPGEGIRPFGNEPAIVLRNHTGKVHEMAAAVRAGELPKPDLVILPENSTDIDPYRNEYARQAIDAAVKDIGVPVLVGAVVAIGDAHRATRSLVWDPVTGPGAYYDKRKLVPFGEYTPLQDLVLALWERARLVGRQSIPGTRDGDLRMGPVTVGAVNCYEVAFDDVVRGTVRAGGAVLAVQTNNATYALSDQPWQQLAMSQLRAVEHNRAVVAAAITGVSAYVTPEGRIAWHTAEKTADMNVVTVPIRTEQTIATRIGSAPEWALILVGAGALAAAAWRGRRRVIHRAARGGNESS
ncbi:apolipoprotein N-acyltransferase [Thermostaphylospora chromogena]|uniref:apolipoprotein N-acyltransferase n=1 Tax=Thermostaphylospora chromogena TaxID=35622 RepID=UPI001F6237E3|nr:apolipoprotein N-acyltransferase [Thermostaphylospora chromogena]